MNERTHACLRRFLLASSMSFGIASPAAANAFAEPAAMPGPAPAHEMQRGAHHPDPAAGLRGLNLDEAQQDQVFRVFHDQAPAIRERMKAVRKALHELYALASAPGFDRARGRELADTAATAIADLVLMRAQTMSQVHEILTPEQHSSLAEMRTPGLRREAARIEWLVALHRYAARTSDYQPVLEAQRKMERMEKQGN